MINPKNPRNAGRKPLPDGMRLVSLKLSEQDIALYQGIGKGQVARGVRLGAEILRKEAQDALK